MNPPIDEQCMQLRVCLCVCVCVCACSEKVPTFDTKTNAPREKEDYREGLRNRIYERN